MKVQALVTRDSRGEGNSSFSFSPFCCLGPDLSLGRLFMIVPPDNLFHDWLKVKIALYGVARRGVNSHKNTIDTIIDSQGDHSTSLSMSLLNLSIVLTVE